MRDLDGLIPTSGEKTLPITAGDQGSRYVVIRAAPPGQARRTRERSAIQMHRSTVFHS